MATMVSVPSIQATAFYINCILFLHRFQRQTKQSTLQPFSLGSIYQSTSLNLAFEYDLK